MKPQQRQQHKQQSGVQTSTSSSASIPLKSLVTQHQRVQVHKIQRLSTLVPRVNNNSKNSTNSGKTSLLATPTPPHSNTPSRQLSVGTPPVSSPQPTTQVSGDVQGRTSTSPKQYHNNGSAVHALYQHVESTQLPTAPSLLSAPIVNHRGETGTTNVHSCRNDTSSSIGMSRPSDVCTSLSIPPQASMVSTTSSSPSSISLSLFGTDTPVDAGETADTQITTTLPSLSWCDKYGVSENRPDLWIDQKRKAVGELNKWLDRRFQRESVAFFISGPTGAGKTSVSRLCLLQHNYDCQIISADNVREYGSIGTAIREIATRQALFDRPTALIIDDLDALAAAMVTSSTTSLSHTQIGRSTTGGANSTPTSLSHTANSSFSTQASGLVANTWSELSTAAENSTTTSSSSRTQQRVSNYLADVLSTLRQLSSRQSHPIIFTCTDAADVQVRDIRDVCSKAFLSAPSTDALEHLGWKIIHDENLSTMSTMTIQNIAYQCNGDVRQFLYLLQAQCSKAIVGRLQKQREEEDMKRNPRTIHLLSFTLSTPPSTTGIAAHARGQVTVVPAIGGSDSLAATKDETYNIFTATQAVLFAPSLSESIAAVQGYFTHEPQQLPTMVHQNWPTVFNGCTSRAGTKTTERAKQQQPNTNKKNPPCKLQLLSSSPPHDQQQSCDSALHLTAMRDVSSIESDMESISEAISLYDLMETPGYTQAGGFGGHETMLEFQQYYLPRKVYFHRPKSYRSNNYTKSTTTMNTSSSSFASLSRPKVSLSEFVNCSILLRSARRAAKTISSKLAVIYVERNGDAQDNDAMAVPAFTDNGCSSNNSETTPPTFNITNVNEIADNGVDHSVFRSVRNTCVGSTRQCLLDTTMYLRLMLEHGWVANPDAVVQFCLRQGLTHHDIAEIIDLFPKELPIQIGQNTPQAARTDTEKPATTKATNNLSISSKEVVSRQSTVKRGRPPRKNQTTNIIIPHNNVLSLEERLKECYQTQQYHKKNMHHKGRSASVRHGQQSGGVSSKKRKREDSTTMESYTSADKEDPSMLLMPTHRAKQSKIDALVPHSSSMKSLL